MNLILNKIEENHLWERTIVLKRNEFLKVAGTIDTNIYFVRNGSLRIFLLDENEEHTIRFGYKNNLIASLDSYLSNRPSQNYIQAIKSSEVSVISKESFKRMVSASVELQAHWTNILEELIYQQLEREHDLLISSPLERYKRVLARSPQLFQEIPSKYIAAYLRMTPETLSRIKKS